MKKNRILILMVIAAMLFAALACEISFGTSTEEKVAAELTMQALQQTQTAMAKPPETEEEAPPPEESEPEPAAEEEEEDEIPCNDSHIIGESVSDGTVFDPGEAFEKTWTLRNEGDCDWTTAYTFRFVEGTQMGGASSISVPSVIEPYEDITFQVNLTAPDTPGDYTGVWQLFSNDGEEMGRYWVMITVEDTTPPFAVTSVSYSMADTSIDITCPGNEVVTITANITTSTGGLVSFKWDDSQGCSGCATKSINFDSAGTKSISHTMTVGAAGDYWAKIYIDQPNHQWFGQQNFHVECN